MTRRFRGAAIAVAALVAALTAGPAFAQAAALEVRLREAVLSTDGSTRLVVSVTGAAVKGALNAGNFQVTEAGKAIEGLTVTPLSQTSDQPVAVVLIMDTSGSTSGAPINNAKNAARDFVSNLPANVRVALVSFSDTVTTRTNFIVDKARVNALIGGLQAGGGTALHDAVVRGAQLLQGLPGAQHNIVLFTDGGRQGAPGETNTSKSTQTQAIAAVRAAKAPVFSVGLVTQAFDPAVLQRYAGAVKGGRTASVSQSAQLAGAFAQIATEISSQYVLTYVSDLKEPKDLDISVLAKVGAIQARDTSTVINSRSGDTAPSAQPGGPKPYKSKALIGAFASKTGYYVGVGAGFLGLLLFLGTMMYAPQRGRAAQVLQRGLRIYSRSERKKAKEQEGFLAGTAVGRRAVELVERVPRSEAFEARLQTLLDRAAWPVRSTEFMVIQIAGAIAGALIGFGLLGRWWLGIVFFVGGAIIPRLVLAQRVAKRESAFLAQLPDTLQLLSGSLQAGYGFMQAIDTVAKEAQPPASAEFSRVLAEARLGMPIDEALNSMAERVGGEDFRWVVLAINIQRQVGGNLAALLTTVSNTLREREMVRRQIKVLSAEGRLSAVILVALPFVLAGYISVVNPGYIGKLFDETVGKIMIAGGLVLMTIGVFWMRKIIKIDV
ncbi:MAG: type II secretion system F family protein [Actinomycetota bacterium]